MQKLHDYNNRTGMSMNTINLCCQYWL